MSTLPNPPLQNARIQWQNSGEPYSEQYGDIYFSRAGGLAETRHVFLEANALQQRWLQAEEQGRSVFTIAELGFGTGLNFLATWKLWLETPLQNLRLHYISCEKHPLLREDLKRALASWPELAAQSQTLLASYPEHSPGYHRLHPSTAITLDLYYGDACELLGEQRAHREHCVDAWFLDGFAPRVNPDMWQQQLLQHIHALSREQATLSSYSVTGAVVRELKALGFRVEKRRGFGQKREMLFAELLLPRQPETGQAPAQQRPRVVIIGAGLAGCSTAWQLARRGYEPLVLDYRPAPAQGASGNPQAVLQCRLNRTPGPEWQFNLHSFLYACRFYNGLASESDNAFSWQQCGVLTLDSAYRNTRKSGSKQDYAHYADQVLRFLEPDAASNFAGIDIPEPGMLLPGGGWLNPAALCRHYLRHPAITLLPDTRVAQLDLLDGCWQLLDAEHELITSAEVVVIATSHEAAALEQTADLPIRPLRGQVSFVEATTASRALNCVVCADRYIAPASGDQHCIGASYVKNSIDTGLTVTEQEENLSAITDKFPGLSLQPSQTLWGRAGIRGGSIDFMPMVGQLPDEQAWRGIYGGSQHLSTHSPALGQSLWPGLYVNVAHGSHGVATTPLCAEYLAGLITNEALPLPASAAATIDPVRFLRRRLRKQGL